MKRLYNLLPGIAGGAIVVALAHIVSLAIADQSERVVPTSGIFTGPAYVQKIGDLARSVSSQNKGPTAPANVGGSTVDGLDWIDDSTTPWTKKRFVNGGWVVEGYLDPTNGIFIAVTGGGVGTISAGATVDLGSVPQKNITISGAATITSFGSSAIAGLEKTIRFDNVSVITPSNALLVPGGFPLSTAAGDRALATSLGSGNWEITSFTRANGVPVDAAAVGKPDYSFMASVPPMHLAADGSAVSRSSYPAYLAAVTRVQNGTRTSGNATIASIADTSGFGVGMPVESTGVGASCTIASFVANTSITLNSPACVTASGTSAVTVFLTGYGSSGTTSTVGLPDCVGRSIAGLDPAGARITSAASGINAAAFNSGGGAQVKTLARSDLPNVSPTFAGTAGTATSTGNFVNSLTAVATNAVPGPGFNLLQSGGSGSVISNFTPAGTIQSLNGGVTQTNVNGMPPTLIARCVVRVIP